MEKVKRNIGVDLLRTVLILMIILHHTILRGPVSLRLLEENKYNVQYTFFAFLNAFLVVAVNCFFLISGYFGIKKNFIKLLKLVIATYVISGFLNILFVLLGIQQLEIDFLKSLVFPISQYWFVLVYLILFVIAPYLNVLLQNITIKEQRNLLVFLYLIWCGYAFLIDNPTIGANRGYSVGMAIVLYITGDYISKKRKEKSAGKLALLYIGFSGINGILCVILLIFEKQNWVWKVYSYNNPLVVCGSIALFLVFCSLCYNFRYNIASLGKYTLYIYIVHSTPVFASYYMNMYKRLSKGNVFECLIESFILMLILYLIGLLIGVLYEIIWNLIETKFLKLPIV